MKEFAKSFASLSLGMSILGFQLLGEILTPHEEDEAKGAATRALDSITDATIDQLGPTLRVAFRVFDNVQRGITAVAFESLVLYANDRRNGHAVHSSPIGRRKRGVTPEPERARAATEMNAPVAIKIRRQ